MRIYSFNFQIGHWMVRQERPQLSHPRQPN